MLKAALRNCPNLAELRNIIREEHSLCSATSHRTWASKKLTEFSTFLSDIMPRPSLPTQFLSVFTNL